MQLDNSPHAFKVDIEIEAVSVWEDSVIFKRQRNTQSYNPDMCFSISVTCRSSTLSTKHMTVWKITHISEMTKL